MALRAVKLSESAVLPVKGSPLAAGFDLCSAEYCEVPAGGRYAVKTGLAIALPSGCYGRIAPRSGLAKDFGLHVGAGVIDPDFRGEVIVLLFNHGSQPVSVKPGDRIAQIVCEKFASLYVEEVRTVSELGETVRGAAGFGSTGMNRVSLRRTHGPMKYSLMFDIVMHFSFVPDSNLAHILMREIHSYFDFEKSFRAQDMECPPACFLGCTYKVSDTCLTLSVNVSGEHFQSGEEDIADDLKERVKYCLSKNHLAAPIQVLNVYNCLQPE